MINNFKLKQLGFNNIYDYYDFIFYTQYKLPESILKLFIDNLSPKQKQRCREHIMMLLLIERSEPNEDFTEWLNKIGL